MAADIQLDEMGKVNRVNYFLTVNIALAAWALVFVVMRLFSKVVVLRTFGWDDGMIIMGMACSLTSTIILCMQTKYGLGYHMSDVPPSLYPDFFKIMYAGVLLYIFTCLFVKVSIVLFYRRLGHETNYIRGVWGLIIFNILICITMATPAAFSCKPVAFFWDTTIPGGKCIDQQKLYTVNTALNVTMDFAILLLPIPIVWKAQMALKKRLIVIGLFALGGFVCIASLIRVTKLFGPASAQDITWAAVESHTWSMIEVNAGIVAGCVPQLKPLFRSCFNFLRDTTNGSNSRPTYGNTNDKNYPSYVSGGHENGPTRPSRFKYVPHPSERGGNVYQGPGWKRKSSVANIYHPELTKSEEELMRIDPDREILRVTEFKVEEESRMPSPSTRQAV